jgi:hypothetical protein
MTVKLTIRRCSVEGCNGAHIAKGLCRKHYSRMARHGDPLIAGGTAQGEAKEFYQSVVLKYSGEDCLIWPYAKSESGYGVILRRGMMRNVSRVVCEDAYGPPPTNDHQAAHSCGKGHLGCVSKGHVSWKTPSGNQLDRLAHGTDNRGEKHNLAKLKEKQVREIISLKGHETQQSIACRYGVSSRTVSDIHRGRRWAWMDRH